MAKCTDLQSLSNIDDDDRQKAIKMCEAVCIRNEQRIEGLIKRFKKLIEAQKSFWDCFLELQVAYLLRKRKFQYELERLKNPPDFENKSRDSYSARVENKRSSSG